MTNYLVRTTANLPKEGPTMGIFATKFSVEDFGEYYTIDVRGFHKKKDPAKEIRKEVWEGLNDSAREELKSKGFYCEGEIEADDDNFRVIQSDDF